MHPTYLGHVYVLVSILSANETIFAKYEPQCTGMRLGIKEYAARIAAGVAESAAPGLSD